MEDLFTADQDQEDIAAAMLMLLQGKQKLILPPDPPMDKRRRDRNDRGDRRENPRSSERRGERKGYGNPQPMDLYRIEVGRADGVEVRHIVGAIANEGDINSRYIGHIKLYDDYSTVELPQGMPKELLQQFVKTRVLNKQMQMSFMGATQSDNGRGGNDFGGKGRRAMIVASVVKITSVVNVMVNVVSVNLTIKTTALLMNVVAEIANVNPYLTAP